MNVWHAILLGLVQGLTEFLPISSTAHLTLAENLLLGRSMPLAFDVLLHVGTLGALGLYFRRELARVLAGFLGGDPEGRRLGLWLLLAMVPTGVLGLATKPLKELQKGHLWVYGLFLLLTAGMLWAANRKARKAQGRDLQDLRWQDALAIGTIQGLGGGFGLSRSGSTIAMGVFCGLRLPASARFSFLLGIPTIGAAALVEGRHMLVPVLQGRPLPPEMAFPPGSTHPLWICILGILAAGLAGYAAIGLLDRFTRTPRLTGFALYCLLAGLGVMGLGLFR